MKVSIKEIIATFVLIVPLAIHGYAAPQQPKSLLASASGEGTLKVGREEFKISSVIVKLMEDGNVEITLVSDITIFLSGSWSGRGDAEKGGIDLKITGGTTKGALEGGGKLSLRADGKSIAGLTLEVINKATKRKIDVGFVAK